MVARDPIWTLKRFSATIIDDVWPEVLLFTLVATAVALISEKTDVNLGVSNQLLTVLGLVLALVISFRTSSAYERYQEGRKMWTNITIASRNLAMMIWIHVPNKRPPAAKQSVLESIIEKKTMINLIHAYVVSVKHLLREEKGVYYEDLYPLVSFLPKYTHNPTATEGELADQLPLWHTRDGSDRLVNRPMTSQECAQPTGPSGTSSSSYPTVRDNKQRPQRPPLRPVTPDIEGTLPTSTISDHPLKPARNPPPVTVYDYIPALGLIIWLIRKMLRLEIPNEKKKKKGRKKAVESHIPLEISLVLSNYSGWLMRSGLVQPAIATGMTNNLGSLQDTVLNLERICNTPLPFAYQVHLRMSLWMYLTFLPFQIYLAYGLVTIPATAFAAFLLLGFLEIGQEIEDPFDYDKNDLDLDFFCLLIQRDLQEITAYPNLDPSSFIFTNWNQPFAPADSRSAEVLTCTNESYHNTSSTEPGMNSIHRTLVNGWKIVDDLTRGEK